MQQTSTAAHPAVRALSETVMASVRAEAARAKISYVAIGDRLGLSAKQVGRKLNGETSPFTIDELGELAVMFGLTHQDGTPDLSEFFRTDRANLSRSVA